MTFISVIASALVEAWAEVRVQKARVVLSLVGVVAAVAAMTTVMALGDLVVQSGREIEEVYNGRATTIHVSAVPTTAGTDSSDGSVAAGTTDDNANPAQASSDETDENGVLRPELGRPVDPAGDAAATVAQRFSIAYWSRLQTNNLEMRELNEVFTTGAFRGKMVTLPTSLLATDGGVAPPVQVTAVDPNYQVIFRLQLLQGRWIQHSDANMLLTPVVINQIFWDALGNPDLSTPLVLNTMNGQQQFRVVGVVKAKSQWDGAQILMDYGAWQYVKSSSLQNSDNTSGASMGNGEMGSAMYSDNSLDTTEMLVWVNPSQIEEARSMLPSALKSVLGEGWETSAWGGDQQQGAEDQLGIIRVVIMLIGGIVIFLGALGLLNVAIVTVKQRVREIGIRRAVGASRQRVFFSVFLESVVATLVAGIIGVGLAIVIVRFLPLEQMDLIIQDVPAFPMSAALAGVGISSAVGALCGIIPAFAAVAVKPIDAIRY